MKEVDNLGWPKDQYAITSSGALAIRGIREAHDLDIIVLPALWEKLAQEYKVEELFVAGGSFHHIQIGDIEIFGPDSLFISPPMPTAKQQIESADIIEGHRFVQLEFVEQAKKLLHREKDDSDVEAIDTLVKDTDMGTQLPHPKT